MFTLGAMISTGSISTGSTGSTGLTGANSVLMGLVGSSYLGSSTYFGSGTGRLIGSTFLISFYMGSSSTGSSTGFDSTGYTSSTGFSSTSLVWGRDPILKGILPKGVGSTGLVASSIFSCTIFLTGNFSSFSLGGVKVSPLLSGTRKMLGSGVGLKRWESAIQNELL